MIFSTLNQFNCFVIFVFLGFLFGILFNVFSVLFLKKYQKIFQKIIFEGIFYTFFAIFYVIFLNFFNFGKISFALILAIVLGFLWAKKLLLNLVVFLQNKWYNFLTIRQAKKHEERKHKALKP